MAINKVMGLGAGTMGMGIAQVFAEAGKTVIVRDIADAFIQRGEGVLKKNMEKKVAKGKITEEQKNETLGRVSFTLELADAKIVGRDPERERFLAAYDRASGKFQFVLYNEKGVPSVYINSAGDAVFTGKAESAAIFASTIVGTDSASYAAGSGGVFVLLDPTGMKIMQDQNGKRRQKLGMSVGDDGTSCLVLGAGNGEGSHSVNGVVYTNGTFKIEKNDQYANMGLVGYAPFVTFWEESGELWLSGSRVLVNGVDLAAKIQELEKRIEGLSA